MDGGDSSTKEILMKFGIVPDEEDVKIVQYVCEVVSNRAALLVSICKFKYVIELVVLNNISLLIKFISLGLAVLLKRIDKKSVTIAVDGSLYKHHPRLETWIKRYIPLLAPDHKVCFHIIFFIVLF